MKKGKIWVEAQFLRSQYPALDKLMTAYENQKGFSGVGGMAILGAVISIVVTIIVLANAIPVLWPLATTASGNITAMVGTDAGTSLIKQFWPIVLLLVGIGIAIALIVYALKKFGVLV